MGANREQSLHGGQTDEDESQNKAIHTPHLFLDLGLKPQTHGTRPKILFLR
jgi:hypothetical protein